jgi:spore coat polysaccharide biosynthesis protein SpsF
MHKKPKVVSVIEARMNSSRLYGKVMKKINNVPLIELLYDRVKKSKLIDEIVIATTNKKSDDKFVQFLDAKKIKYFRGSESNVLNRVKNTAKKFKAKIIVRLTGDNPLMDPNIIDYMLNIFLKNTKKYDYLTNNGFGIYENRYLPYGLDVQIFKYKDFIKSCNKLKKKDLKEHPGLYFYREGKKKYKLMNVIMPKKWRTDLNLRLTVDTKDDLKFVKIIFSKLGKKLNNFFTYDQIINFLQKNPKLIEINNKVIQKTVRLI